MTTPRTELVGPRRAIHLRPTVRRPRLVYVVTHPVTADLLLRGQLAFMREQGFDVTVVSSPGPELDRVRAREAVETVAVPMVRANDLRRDAVSLVHLTAALRRLRPDIVNAGTPKAGLLGMVAARALSVPVRIYLLRGLRLETVQGALREVLVATEKIACFCAHDVACVSPSLLRTATEGGYIPARKAVVIGEGSSNGVDSARFRRTDALRRAGSAQLGALGVGAEDRVVAFVGRLAADKGIDELLDAFAIVRREVPNAKLVLLGGDLGDEKADRRLLARVSGAPDVISTKTIADLAPYYARIDVLAFPSYREGFPNVPLEAASAEVPVVGFHSTGVVDAVKDGETGELVRRDAGELARAIIGYLHDPVRAAAHGRAARSRVERSYDRHAVWQAWLDAYRTRLASRGLPLPIPT